VLVERMYNKLNGLAGRTITYTWNRAGQLTSVHLSGNTHRWWYTYNALGQLHQVRSNTSTTQVTDAAYTWWPAGMVRNETLGNRTNAHGYDARDRLLTINNTGSSTHRFSARYTWENNSTISIAEFRQPSSPHTRKRYRHTLTYDSRNQLSTAQYQYHTGTAWQSGNEFRVFGIQYDRDGKITWKHVQNGSFAEELYMVYAYAAGTNRITFIDEYINQVGTPISYDANANMTAIGAPVGLSSGVYDRRNLLVSASSGGQNLNWRYDHQGLLVYRQVAGDHILTLREAFGEPLAVYRNGALDQWNLLRPDRTVIGRRQGSDRLYYHRDLLGSTRTVVNASGGVEQTWDYYPFDL